MKVVSNLGAKESQITREIEDEKFHSGDVMHNNKTGETVIILPSFFKDTEDNSHSMDNMVIPVFSLKDNKIHNKNFLFYVDKLWHKVPAKLVIGSNN